MAVIATPGRDAEQPDLAWNPQLELADMISRIGVERVQTVDALCPNQPAMADLVEANRGAAPARRAVTSRSVSVTMDTCSHAIPTLQAEAASRTASVIDG